MPLFHLDLHAFIRSAVGIHHRLIWTLGFASLGLLRRSERGLTQRETEIVRWLIEGKANPEIALILQISPRTVEKHMESILRKLGVENRTAAALLVATK